MRYVQKALKTDVLDNIQVIMLQNCHTYNSTTGLEHNGFSIANCPFTQNETEGFAYMVRHEACGHGFGYLEDEYITSSSPSPSIKDT